MSAGRISILSSDDMERVHESTLRLLNEPGICVQSERALKLLEARGAKTDRKTMRARLPEDLVKETIKLMPKTIRLSARNPKQDMIAPKNGLPFMATNGTGVYVIDLETGEKRTSMGKDLRDLLVLCDAIDSLDYVWPLVTAHDGPANAHGLNDLVIALRSTTKHFQGEAMSGGEAADMVEVGAAVAGGKDALAKRPLFSVVQCPICPLEFEKGSVEAVMEFAKAGIPVVSMAMALCGLTAPVTIAGATAIVNAENLASFAISQMTKPGAPVIYSSESSRINMMTGEIHYGAMEQVFIAAAVAQMAKRYGAPTMVGTFGVGLHGDRPGISSDPGELVFETMTNMTLTDFSSGIGGLDQAKGASLEQIIIDSDLWELIRSMRRDVAFDKEHFVEDLIASVGPGGNFLKVPHTAKNMRRELFLPSNEKAKFYESYRLNRDGKKIVEQARERAKSILRTHRPEPIGADAERRIEAVLGKHMR